MLIMSLAPASFVSQSAPFLSEQNELCADEKFHFRGLLLEERVYKYVQILLAHIDEIVTPSQKVGIVSSFIEIGMEKPELEEIFYCSCSSHTSLHIVLDWREDLNELMFEAASDGDVESILRLTAIRTDPTVGLRFRRILEELVQGGRSLEAVYQLARVFMLETNTQYEGGRLLIKAAQEGHRTSLFDFASGCQLGSFFVEKDHQKALAIFQNLIVQGPIKSTKKTFIHTREYLRDHSISRLSRIVIADITIYGQGVPQDVKRGVEMLSTEIAAIRDDFSYTDMQQLVSLRLQPFIVSKSFEDAKI
jgi:hypothetical protein